MRSRGREKEWKITKERGEVGGANTKAPMILSSQRSSSKFNGCLTHGDDSRENEAEATHTQVIVSQKKQKHTCTFVSVQYDILKPWLDMKK